MKTPTIFKNEEKKAAGVEVRADMEVYDFENHPFYGDDDRSAPKMPSQIFGGEDFWRSSPHV